MIKALDGSVAAQQLSSTNAWAESPVISESADGKLHALWVKQTPSGSSIMWSQGDETGFSIPTEISGGNFSHSPGIALVNGDLIAVWQSDESLSKIESKIWTGSEWASEEIVTSGQNHFINPVVCSTPDGEQAVYWQEGRSNAIAMASVHSSEGWSTPFSVVSPGGPVWSPIASGNNVYWAGTEGDDWNIFTENTTGIEQGSSFVNFLPSIVTNPVRSNVEIRLPDGIEAFSGSIKLFDITGRMVLETVISIEGSNVLSVNCSTLPSGVYSLVMQNAAVPVRFTLLR